VCDSVSHVLYLYTRAQLEEEEKNRKNQGMQEKNNQGVLLLA